MHGTELQSAVSKVKWRILPLFVVLFIVNYIDRTNLTIIKSEFCSHFGLDEIAYGFGFGLFFWGYALLEVPANMALERLGAKRWLTIITLVWGIIAVCFAFASNKYMFYFLRIALGAAEAGFFPGVVYYFTRWLPSAERGKAMAVFLSGSAIATIISGPLASLLLQIKAEGLQPWQWMIVVEGGFSVIMAAVLWIWLVSLPHEARWLTQGEKDALLHELDQEHSSHGAPSSSNKWKLLFSPKLLGLCGIYFSIQLTIWGITAWLPDFIKEMLRTPSDLTGVIAWTKNLVAWLGFSEQAAIDQMTLGLLNSIPWVFSILGMYLAALGAARWKNQYAWLAAALILAGAGMLVAGFSSNATAFTAICIAALGFKSAASLYWPIPQSSLEPYIAAAGIALINSIGNLAGSAAPFAFGWIKQTTGSIHAGFYALAFTSTLTAFLVFQFRPRVST